MTGRGDCKSSLSDCRNGAGKVDQFSAPHRHYQGRRESRIYTYFLLTIQAKKREEEARRQWYVPPLLAKRGGSHRPLPHFSIGHTEAKKKGEGRRSIHFGLERGATYFPQEPWKEKEQGPVLSQ